jgi:hypothetical protein
MATMDSRRHADLSGPICTSMSASDLSPILMLQQRASENDRRFRAESQLGEG